MDFFKFFNIRIRLKRKYRIILVCAIIFILVFHLLTMLGFCATEENVNLGVIENVLLTSSGVSSPSFYRFSASDISNTYYFETVKGYTYTIHKPIGEDSFLLGASDKFQTSGEITKVGIFDEYTFTASENGVYYYMSRYSYGYDNIPTVSVVSNVSDMPLALKKLIDSINQDTLGQVFVDAIPYVSVVVLISVGIYLISKMIIGLNNGKAKV